MQVSKPEPVVPETLAETSNTANTVAEAAPLTKMPQSVEEAPKRKLEDGCDEFEKIFTKNGDRISADLSNGKTSRKLAISSYRGAPTIHIREFYEKEGEWLPGKKGIALNLDQYRELEKLVKSGGVDWALENIPAEKAQEPKKKRLKKKKGGEEEE